MPRDTAGRKAAVPDQEYWLDVDRGAVIKSIEVTEDAAKQLVTLTSLLQGIYFAAVSFSEIRQIVAQLQSWQIVVLVSPFAFWLASLYFASRVFVPKEYGGLDSDKEEAWVALKKEYQTIRDDKFRDLQRARRFLLLSLLFLFIVLITYLVNIPAPPTT